MGDSEESRTISGGKYTWGGVLDGEKEMGPVDWNDPNYDSGEQGVSYHLQLTVEIKLYKQAVRFPARSCRASGSTQRFQMPLQRTQMCPRPNLQVIVYSEII